MKKWLIGISLALFILVIIGCGSTSSTSENYSTKYFKYAVSDIYSNGNHLQSLVRINESTNEQEIVIDDLYAQYNTYFQIEEQPDNSDTIILKTVVEEGEGQLYEYNTLNGTFKLI
ncbi:MAG: hypothetical protein UT55_C0037G0002 [Candidatus Peregrinibacteria bacterium GW2011_GWE2_39_6]|nr:MAG: hypothetical protein UT36_C0003G0049 [Candidatus Peregrinibacteria bacterium GW2011_GWF2_39_17]KKR25583.1 MAG: hypothetical protein UT55_C0037G0002 [Candidatus Peregrinibacteria bacterium GW2011_GWE2_39_6]HCW31988.1 hypothetical protein [Candidatus Peregrinibacteria bacterium]